MRRAPRLGCTVAAFAFALALACARVASAATLEVGPGKRFASVVEAAALVDPGDVIEVSGDEALRDGVVFTRSGTAEAPIVVRGVRGVRDGARRPVLSGGLSTVELRGDHYRFEGFEVTGGARRCVTHAAHGITIRDVLVRDCPGHGILGEDARSGSLTLEWVEVRNAGSGDTRHPIYIATDESAHPGSVFRMEHCFVHDGNGGNNVKSRAERNEIRYNWIEGALYHEIELIGPDGQDESLAREDSDVVGNVFRKTGKHVLARVGGDGTGQTWGRYRFVNNTFLLAQGSAAAIRLFAGVDAVEMHNNVFYRQGGGGGVQVFRGAEASLARGAIAMAGSANWVPAGSTDVPATWVGTTWGVDPGFTAPDELDFAPHAASDLAGAGVTTAVGAGGHAFPWPLELPRYEPPVASIAPVGVARARAPAPAGADRVDVGAFAQRGPRPSRFGADAGRAPVAAPGPALATVAVGIAFAALCGACLALGALVARRRPDA